MSYAINHVHTRAKDPDASAAWYEKHFGAKLVSDRQVMPGTRTLTLELDGPVRLNISSKPEGTPDNKPVAELNQLGLEHYGFGVEDIEADIDRFGKAGIRIVLPVTEIIGGTKIAFIEGPDDVLIELVQPATP